MLTGGDTATEREILTDFRRVNGTDVAMLELALEKRDFAQITNASERIEGASRTVGATRLAAACARLERASRAGDWDETGRHMGVFQRELARLNAYCEKAEYTSTT